MFLHKILPFVVVVEALAAVSEQCANVVQTNSLLQHVAERTLVLADKNEEKGKRRFELQPAPACIKKEVEEMFPEKPPETADDCIKLEGLDTSKCDAEIKEKIADFIEGGCGLNEGEGSGDDADDDEGEGSGSGDDGDGDDGDDESDDADDGADADDAVDDSDADDADADDADDDDADDDDADDDDANEDANEDQHEDWPTEDSHEGENEDQSKLGVWRRRRRGRGFVGGITHTVVQKSKSAGNAVGNVYHKNIKSTKFHVGPLDVDLSGSIAVTPKLQLGASGSNYELTTGFGDFREGIHFATTAQVKTQFSIEASNPWDFFAKLNRKGAHMRGGWNRGVSSVISIARKLLNIEIGRLPMTGLVKISDGPSAVVGASVGWANKDGFHMFGVSGAHSMFANVYFGAKAGAVRIVLGMGRMTLDLVVTYGNHRRPSCRCTNRCAVYKGRRWCYVNWGGCSDAKKGQKKWWSYKACR